MYNQTATQEKPNQFISHQHVTSHFRARTLRTSEFRRISDLVYGTCGINLHDGKQELVQGRLNKRLRELGMIEYHDYIDFIEQDATGMELSIMVDTLTTNLTYFFREKDHFDYFRDELLSNIGATGTKDFFIWSAGCSSGEEPYSLAMMMREYVENIDRINGLILATDISSRMLEIARNGVYRETRMKGVPIDFKNKYFTRRECRRDKEYVVNDNISSMIRFRRLNLNERLPVKGPFDMIMCRNVMIYFDKKTQEELVAKFYDCLMPGGVLLVGHSESLTRIEHKFDYVRPSIYKKPCK